MASTAAKAIWGENNNNNNNENTKPSTETMTNETKGTEPVSGKLGDTSAGEPFDAGNLESGATNTETSTAPSTTQTGSESTSSGLPATTSTDTTPAGSKDSTAQSGAKGPTADHPSTTGDTGFKAPQADIRDPDSATADPKKEAERKNVDNTGGLDTSENPTKLEGAGPKPIEEVAKSHGGDAGSASKESSGATGTDEDGPGAESKGEGTGEQYVKSSGLAADGGDFDATKPGAGREADRLLEEKGMTTQTAAAASSDKKAEEDKAEKTATAPDSPDSKKEKASLKDKIKAKLHKN